MLCCVTANHNIGVQVEDAFVEMKHQVAEVVTTWNERSGFQCSAFLRPIIVYKSRFHSVTAKFNM